LTRSSQFIAIYSHVYLRFLFANLVGKHYTVPQGKLVYSFGIIGTVATPLGQGHREFLL